MNYLSINHIKYEKSDPEVTVTIKYDIDGDDKEKSQELDPDKNKEYGYINILRLLTCRLSYILPEFVVGL